MQNDPIGKPFTEYFQAIEPDAESKIKRCLNANDEVCKYPDCKCLGVVKPKQQKEEVMWVPV